MGDKFDQWFAVESRLRENNLFLRLMGQEKGAEWFDDNLHDSFTKLAGYWLQEHRFYHGVQHLTDLFSLMEAVPNELRELLEVIAVFHDVVYDPRSNKNEEESLHVFRNMVVNYEDLQRDSSIFAIETAIMESITGVGSTAISKDFQAMDRWYLTTQKSPMKVLEIEMNIFKEYQYVDFITYRDNRIKFLLANGASKDHLNVIGDFKPHIGIYAGSFNPFHRGHLNILKKAEQLLDKVIIAIGTNPEKSGKDIIGRKLTIQELLPFHQVELVPGLLTEYMASMLVYVDVTLVRGLRTGFDFNYEQTQLRYMEDMYKDKNNCRMPLKVIYIPCDRELEYVSSSSIRAIAQFDLDKSKQYIPKREE